MFEGKIPQTPEKTPYLQHTVFGGKKFATNPKTAPEVRNTTKKSNVVGFPYRSVEPSIMGPKKKTWVKMCFFTKCCVLCLGCLMTEYC